MIAVLAGDACPTTGLVRNQAFLIQRERLIAHRNDFMA
jgi:hypothetical protein